MLELGCADGELLAALNPSYGVGVDFSPNAIRLAEEKFPFLHFYVADVEDFNLPVNPDGSVPQFDYVILSDVLHVLYDVQQVLHNLGKFCHAGTRIVISNYNFLWEPLLRMGEWLGIKQKIPNPNWLSHHDVYNLLELEGFQVVSRTQKLILPKYFPLLNALFNKLLVNLPVFSHLGLVGLITARKLSTREHAYSASIVIPARNEKGNIENAIRRIPAFGISQEILFVEGHSSDGTFEEMLRVQSLYPRHNIRVMKQNGKGKGNAVREAFEAATGDVLMILDADLTTPPEDLVKFYQAIATGRGEFINGCRLVYPMEKEAMRFLNLLGNKFFSLFFSFLLGQRIKDTLCGTKVLLKSDYVKISRNRAFFGDFDPFGDFDLLFGAAKLNLKITELIVRYKDRQYGSTQISRFRHGLLLLRMSFFAAMKLKFR